jgi:HAD superfamily hydrolase (TIGR01509 family)
MIRAIFWDNDGVLVDTEGLYYAATQQILSSVGVVLSKEQYIELILVQGKGAWHLVRELGIPSEQVDRLRKKRDALYATLLKRNSRVIDGVEETLASLHGRYVMGVVTSSKREHFELIHRTSGLLQYFDFILTGGDYKKFKPDPEPYLLAVEKSGLRKDECVAIEDSERGLRSAKSAGIHCFIIPTELTQTGDFSQADKILSNIKDVLREFTP